MHSTLHRKPTLWQAALPLLALFLLLIGGHGFLHYRLEPILLVAAAVAAVGARRAGYSYLEMARGIIEIIGHAMPAILIMIAIGIMIASWIAAGTIPMLVCFGTQILSPRYFLLSAAVICSVTSLFTGTSWGTVGTIGVALIGIASSFGVSHDAAAGAIISGAYFGDKLSPLSDQTNLAPLMAGAGLREHIRWLLWTTTPAWLLAAACYAAVGLASGDPIAATANVLEAPLRSTFRFNILLLIPPGIVACCMVTRRPVLPSILTASGAGMAIAVWVQGRSLWDVVGWVLTGYRSQTGVPQVDVLLSRGGVASMAEIILLLSGAFAFSGIMVRCGFFARILDSVLGQAYGRFRLILFTGLTGILTGLVTGSSHLSVLIPGQAFRGAYLSAGLAAKNLSRTTEDFGTAVVPLIPWSAAGLFMSSTLDVPTLRYLPWAIMNYTGLVFALAYAATGIAIAPISDSRPDSRAASGLALSNSPRFR